MAGQAYAQNPVTPQRVTQGISDNPNAPSWFSSLVHNPMDSVENWLHEHVGGGYAVDPNQPTLGEEGLGALNRYVYQPLQRGGTTAALLGDPAYRAEHGTDIGQAWKDASTTNIGQAVLGSSQVTPLFGHGVFPLGGVGDGRHAYGNVPTNAYGGIDVTSPQVRAAAENDQTFNLSTAGANFLYTYFADPLVIGGKVAKPLIAAERGRQVATPARIAEENAARKALGEKLAADKARNIPGLEFRPGEPGEHAVTSGNEVLHAYVNGEKAGTITYRRNPDYLETNAGALQINSIGVEDKFQRKGIATALHREVEARTGEALQHGDDLTAAGQAFAQATPPGLGVTPTTLENLSGREQGWLHLYENRQNVPYMLGWMGGRHSGVHQEMTLVHALSGTKDWNEFSTVLSAARGDPLARDRLAEMAPSISEALDQANWAKDYLLVARDQIPKFTTDPASGVKIYHPEWMLLDADAKAANAAVTDAIARNDWLNRMMGDFQSDNSKIFASLRHNQLVSPRTVINENRATTAAMSAASWGGRHWADQIVAPIGGSGRILHVMGWVAGDAPPGVISTAGAMAEDSWRGVRDVLRSAKMSDEVTANWVQAYINAPTANARQSVLVRMEEDLSRRIFDRYTPEGASEATKANMKTHADQFFREYQSQRNLALEDLHKNNGWVHDVDSGRSTKLPVYEDQQAGHVPIMDFQMLHQALGEFEKEGTLEGFLKSGRDVGLNVIGAFSPIWKAGVLLRVGAIPRNLGESWLASWVFTHRILQGNPVIGAALGVRNTYDRAVSRYRSLYRDPANSLLRPAEIRGLINDRLGILLRNQAAKRGELEELIKETRESGGAAYYATVPQHGSAVEHEVIQRQIAASSLESGKAGRPLLNATEREQYQKYAAILEQRPLKRGERANFQALHAKATKRYLATRPNEHVVVQRDGQWTQVPRGSLSEEDLAPNRIGTVKGDLGRPAVYTVPKFKEAMKSSPIERAARPEGQIATPAEEAAFVPGTIQPDWVSLYGENAIQDANDLRAGIASDAAKIEETRQNLLTLEGEYFAPARRVTQGQRGSVVGPYTSQGPREGVAGKLVEDLLSARKKNEVVYSTMEGQKASSRRFGRRMGIVNGSYKTYTPDHPMYYDASAEVANRQVRNSELAMHLLTHDDPEATTKWLLTTDEGRGILKEINLNKSYDDAVAEWTYRAHYNLMRAYPNEALRRDILQGEVTSQQVRAYLHGREDLVPTIAREYLPSLRVTKARDAIDLFIDRAFHFMWSLPEDKLARYPLYDHLYRSEWNSIVRENLPYLQTLDEKEANAWIRANADTSARTYATRTTQRVVYSSERRNNVAEKMRFISPFLQVTGNRFYFYGTQALENPQQIARLFLGWNAIPTITDDQGNEIAYLHLPGPVAKALHMEDLPTLAFQKSSFNLIQSGEPWWSPGFGPVVTVPAGELLRRNADSPIAKYLTEKLGAVGVFPSAYLGQSAWDQLLPTWGRRFLAGQGQQAANTAAMIAAVETWRYEQGLRSTPPSKQEINERNDHLWAFRVLAAFVSPAQPTPQNDMVAHYTQIHRDYVKKFGKDAEAKFLEDHPEYYDIVLSYTQNPTGIAPTQQASALESKNGYLLDSLPDPSMGAMVTNVPGSTGQFDQAAYYWQMNRPLVEGSATAIRSGVAGDTALNNRIISKGWIMYRDATKERDSLLEGQKQIGGSSSINAKDNLWIKALFQSKKDAIMQATTVARPDGSSFSPWGEDLAQQDDALYGKRADSLRLIVTNPESKNNPAVKPWLSSGAQYLDLRNELHDLLEEADKAGGSADINARSNLWIKALWDIGRGDIAAANPLWGEWQNRYFANDNLTIIPGGEPSGGGP